MTKALQFSGGKDSLACLYMFRDDPEVVVVYTDTGAAFPHMREFVHRTAKKLGVRLHVASPAKPCADWQIENGFPADVVAWDATPQMRHMTGCKTAPVVPYATCCAVNLWMPMQEAVAALGADTVIRGSKACDDKKSVPDGYVENGITYLSPLWTWSDEDVFSYLQSVGAEIPPQYAMGGDSLDCWCCTGYMGTHGTKRFAFMRDNYPDLYADAAARLRAVKETTLSAIGALNLEAP
jgi:3'-phosphoadenosine 5'-phosphosulfate sulfotransferase (PAPS reductase)/FAD synthetase